MHLCVIAAALAATAAALGIARETAATETEIAIGIEIEIGGGTEAAIAGPALGRKTVIVAETAMPPLLLLQ